MKTAAHWKPIGQRAHDGILVPLFSLHTKTSGRGTFLDLIPLINWCKKIGFDTIQLLPLNDSGNDPSPYNPISSCALDPVYLTIPQIKTDLQTPRQTIKDQKLEWLYKEYMKNPIDLAEFAKENRWIEAYGKFLGDLEFHTYVQHRCFTQMKSIKQHAIHQGIFLKGDLPHLISPESADVWAHPHLFRRDLVAGAPPDKYNLLGQKWGFPLYDWDAMRKDHFAWWKERFRAIEKLYHIYRLDHVVGFFRIWGMPADKEATEGHFVPKDQSLWMPLGREILEMMISSSPLLPMAEDLGTIPDGVYPILRELGICGVKVLRWQKKELLASEYEPFSVTTVSTPDMEPLQVYEPDLTREGRLSLLKWAHSTSSYFHINLLQEYLALFPELSWPDPHKDRINTPGTINDGNWSYHFRPSLEEFTSHEGLASAMRQM